MRIIRSISQWIAGLWYELTSLDDYIDEVHREVTHNKLFEAFHQRSTKDQ